MSGRRPTTSFLPKSLVEPFVATKAIGDTGTAALEQLTLADFIDAGHFDRHLRRTTASNGARRKALVEALGEQFGDRAEICGANAGLHVFAWLKGKKWRPDQGRRRKGRKGQYRIVHGGSILCEASGPHRNLTGIRALTRTRYSRRHPSAGCGIKISDRLITSEQPAWPAYCSRSAVFRC